MATVPEWPTLDTFVAAQRWEGKVTEVRADTFVAEVADLTGDEREELAEFSIIELSPGDRGLLQPGAVFYWSIGHRDRPTGQRLNESILVFRRMPKVDRDDKQAEDEAYLIKRDLEW